MRLPCFIGFLIVFIGLAQGRACVTTEQISPLNPQVQVRTYFWMPQLKRGVRIAQTTVDKKNFFIMMGCRGSQAPSIEIMDDWTSVECRSLGNIWLPMQGPGKSKTPETSYFLRKFEESLEDYSRQFSHDDLVTKAVDITKVFIKGSFGLALVTLPGLPKDSSFRKKWLRKLVKGMGLIWIVNALWEMFDIYRQNSGTHENEAQAELEEILIAIEENNILHLDGQETDRRIDNLFSFDSILNSFEEAALQTYEDICQEG